MSTIGAITRAANLMVLRNSKVSAISNPSHAVKTCLRFAHFHRKNCRQIVPRCSEKVLAKSACRKRMEKEKKGAKKPPPVPKECCPNPCPDAFPRFDDLYYKPSNKWRKYAQTWYECPKLKIVAKQICCYEHFQVEPMERRKRKKGNKTCGPQGVIAECCSSQANRKCIKIVLPRCRKSREPPKCGGIRTKKNCRKICTPFPSFSECKKPRIRPLRPVECKCLDLAAMCDVFAALRKLKG